MIFLSDNGIAYLVEGPAPSIEEAHVLAYYSHQHEQHLTLTKAAREAEWLAACSNDYW
jgi:hypothetical protein